MTEQPQAQSAAATLPPSDNGTSRQAPAPATPRPTKAGLAHTRISGMRTGLIAGFAVLVVVMIFIIQNASAVSISFLGAHLHVSLAVALLLAVIAGALIMAAAGTARITQLRRILRRDRRKLRAT